MLGGIFGPIVAVWLGGLLLCIWGVCQRIKEHPPPTIKTVHMA